MSGYDIAINAPKAVEKTVLLDNYVYINRVATSTFWIFCKPPGGRWQLFQFQREEDAGINVENWRIRDFKVSKGLARTPLESNWSTASSIALVTQGSQWEYAFQEVGEVDFMGGYHGDELFSALAIMVDGKPVVTDTGAGPITTMAVGETRAALDLRIGVESKLYRPSSPSTEVAQVSREYSFDPLGVACRYQVKWSVAANLSLNQYVAMLPIVRSATVSTKARFLGEGTIMDVSASGFTEQHKNVYGAEYWNDTNNLRVRVAVLDPAVSLNNYANNGNTKTYISNSATYNKFYAARVGVPTAYTTTVGEIWQCGWRVEAYMPHDET